ncbi:hypothetical protein PR048_016196 [Dryococelus australis]|uniref:Uncharacterized protein n=1 Tax=Dryococelus australis TaxID=614101 RepID=A0ABQ9HJ31_9NEOP|nr:hypothetical protein PR048_016196 [Dryococelus australis]
MCKHVDARYLFTFAAVITSLSTILRRRSEMSMEERLECKGGGKRKIPEKTSRPVASSSADPACEYPEEPSRRDLNLEGDGGITVVERLACPPPTMAIRVQYFTLTGGTGWNMEQRRNARTGKMGDPLQSPTDPRHRPARLPCVEIRKRPRLTRIALPMRVTRGEYGARPGETGDPRENPQPSNFVWQDSHVRNRVATLPGIEPGWPRWEVRALPSQPTTAPVFSTIFAKTSTPHVCWAGLLVCKYGRRGAAAAHGTMTAFPSLVHHLDHWLDSSPPTKANWVQSLAGSLPDFCKWEPCRTIPLVGEFSRGSPVFPTFAFRLLRNYVNNAHGRFRGSRKIIIASFNCRVVSGLRLCDISHVLILCACLGTPVSGSSKRRSLQYRSGASSMFPYDTINSSYLKCEFALWPTHIALELKHSLSGTIGNTISVSGFVPGVNHGIDARLRIPSTQPYPSLCGHLVICSSYPPRDCPVWQGIIPNNFYQLPVTFSGSSPTENGYFDARELLNTGYIHLARRSPGN